MLWLGIILIILAVGLIIGEFFTGSGLLLVSGIAALIFGIIVLFTQGSLFVQVNWWLVIPLVIVILGLIGFIIWRILNTYRHKVVTGQEELPGQTVIVKQKLDPEGIVFYQGENWNAVSLSGPINPGEEALVERIEGLTLYVKRKI